MFVLLGILVIGLVIVDEVLMGLGLDVGLELREGAKGRADFAPTDIPQGLAFAWFEGTHVLVGVGLRIIFGDIHDLVDRGQLRIHRSMWVDTCTHTPQHQIYASAAVSGSGSGSGSGYNFSGE